MCIRDSLQPTPLSFARSRWHLRLGLCAANPWLGVETKAHCATLTLAESLRRAAGQLHPPGMSGPYDRAQRATLASAAHGLPQLLSSAPHAQVAGRGLPGTAAGWATHPRQY